MILLLKKNLALDVPLSSFLQVFAAGTGEVLTYHQEEVAQLYPQEGWVEQDPMALLKSVLTCIEKTVENLR